MRLSGDKRERKIEQENKENIQFLSPFHTLVPILTHPQALSAYPPPAIRMRKLLKQRNNGISTQNIKYLMRSL